jgi:transketolase N-terminal domain/subunit
MTVIVSETMYDILIQTMISQSALMTVLLEKGLIDEDDLKNFETHKLRLFAEADQIKAKIVDDNTK